MQNVINIQENRGNKEEFILVSQAELKSLYRKLIEAEKVIEEYKNKEKIWQEILKINS